MPFYISVASLISRYGQDALTRGADRDGDVDMDSDPVDNAILDAEGEVNSYIGVKYNLPLPGVTDISAPELNTSVPPSIFRVASDIAFYRLAIEHDSLTKEKRKRYDDAVMWLKRVADGTASLGIEVPAPSSGGGVTQSSNDRLFTREKMDGLI